jgi:hypothetical protein
MEVSASHLGNQFDSFEVDQIECWKSVANQDKRMLVVS